MVCQMVNDLHAHGVSADAGGEGALAKLSGDNAWKQLLTCLRAYRMQPTLLSDSALLGRLANAAAADMLQLAITGEQPLWAGVCLA